MTVPELIAYYRQLLIQQYLDRPKAQATVEAFVKQMLADLIFVAVRDGFDPNLAVGAQLDLMGTYRGVKRSIFGLDLERDYFAMPGYDDADPTTVLGFAGYDDGPDPLHFFLQYIDAEQLTYSLNDDEMQQLIKFRAAVHSSALGLGEIDEILYDFFGDLVTITDNEDMTIVYNNAGLAGPFFDILVETNSLPRPAGVSLTVTP